MIFEGVKQFMYIIQFDLSTKYLKKHSKLFLFSEVKNFYFREA